jgi:hypothetical protein
MDARAIEGIGEIAEQATLRVNKPTRHVKSAWGISPNIEHTHVPREPKPIPAKASEMAAALPPAARLDDEGSISML